MAQQQNLSHLLNPFMEKTAQTCFVERRDIWTSLPVTHTSLAYRLPSSSGCENTGSGGMQEKQVSLVDFSLPNRGTLTFSCDPQVPLSGVPPHVCYLPFFSTWMREWTQRTTRHYRGGSTSLPGPVHLSPSHFLLASLKKKLLVSYLQVDVAQNTFTGSITSV